jgi:hypothetical protein
MTTNVRYKVTIDIDLHGNKSVGAVLKSSVCNGFVLAIPIEIIQGPLP